MNTRSGSAPRARYRWPPVSRRWGNFVSSIAPLLPEPSLAELGRQRRNYLLGAEAMRSSPDAGAIPGLAVVRGPERWRRRRLGGEGGYWSGLPFQLCPAATAPTCRVQRFTLCLWNITPHWRKF